MKNCLKDSQGLIYTLEADASGAECPGWCHLTPYPLSECILSQNESMACVSSCDDEKLLTQLCVSKEPLGRV